MGKKGFKMFWNLYYKIFFVLPVKYKWFKIKYWGVYAKKARRKGL